MNRKKRLLISVVIPCLNEEKTITHVIKWAKIGLDKVSGQRKSEIIVVDNGSTDNSFTLAKKTGAKVIREPKKGYGQAYITGIKKSKGDVIIIGDSDATYDFRELPKFIRKLDQGSDLVLGNRFALVSSKASIPTLNRTFGNPVLTFLINFFYRAAVHDSQTGFRAFKRNSFTIMDLKSTGMEFASEMIIKAIFHRLKISEVTISYYPRQTPSKLSLVSDAWRHINSILLYSPTYLFIIPGILIFILGITATLLLLPGPVYIGSVMIDIHTMILSMLLSILGVHTVLIGFFTRVYLTKTIGLPGGMLSKQLIKYVSTELMLSIGIVIFGFSMLIILFIAFSWVFSGFSALSRARELIFASGLSIIGFQIFSSSLLFGLIKGKDSNAFDSN